MFTSALSVEKESCYIGVLDYPGARVSALIMPLFLHHLFMFCLRNQLSHSCISCQNVLLVVVMLLCKFLKDCNCYALVLVQGCCSTYVNIYSNVLLKSIPVVIGEHV